MDVERSSMRGIPLLVLQGEIGHEDCPRLRHALEDAVGQGADRLLLDLSAVPYIDGGCLGMIWVIAESVAAHGWTGIIGANDDIQRLLRLVGVDRDDTFRLFATRRDARASLEPSYTHV